MATYEIDMKKNYEKRWNTVGLANGIYMQMIKKYIQQKI